MTPVATFMMDFEFSDRRPPIQGLTSGHHTVSHHAEDPNKIMQLRLIHAWYGERFASLVNKMKSARDVDGRTLLDNSVLSFSCGMGDGNQHSGRDIAIAVAGTAGGRLRTGRVYTTKRPVADLHRTILRLMGASGPEADGFGDGTGPIAELMV
jgi:hypothetical protein